jgi:hypothetical protein
VGHGPGSAPPQSFGPPPPPPTGTAFGYPPPTQQQVGGVTLTGNPYARPTSSTYKM